MGNKPSLEDQLIDIKLNVKVLERASRKCEKNRTKQLANVKRAIQQGNIEGARIYGENSIREKQVGLNYLKLSSRLDAVASRIETAITTKDISASMGTVVKSMNTALQSMDVEQISVTMSEFEKHFEDLDVITGATMGTLDSATASQMPGDQVDNLIREVADEHSLEVGAMLDDAGTVRTGMPVASQKNTAKQVENNEPALVLPAAPS